MNTDLRHHLVVATHAVHAWATTHPDRAAWLTECLHRHHADDWGDLDQHDRAANAAALADGGRILSRYPVPDWLTDPTTRDDAVWIITDDTADPRGVVTVLWPSDY